MSTILDDIKIKYPTAAATDNSGKVDLREETLSQYSTEYRTVKNDKGEEVQIFDTIDCDRKRYLTSLFAGKTIDEAVAMIDDTQRIAVSGGSCFYFIGAAKYFQKHMRAIETYFYVRWTKGEGNRLTQCLMDGRKFTFKPFSRLLGATVIECHDRHLPFDGEEHTILLTTDSGTAGELWTYDEVPDYYKRILKVLNPLNKEMKLMRDGVGAMVHD